MGRADLNRRAKVVDELKKPLRRLRTGYREMTAQLRGWPSALIIGAQKGGTTSLFNYLVQHPGVLPPLGKEIHYFDLHYASGPDWYRARFPYARQLRSGRITLDATPYYLSHPLAPERAAHLLPKLKLIAVLRNPVDRALSHYQHEVRAGRETYSFTEALDKECERLEGEEERLRTDPAYYSYNHHRYSYTRRGLYLEQLRRWLQHFPRSQLLVLQSERMYREPAVIMAAVHAFLGLRPHQLQHYEPYYGGNYERAMPQAVRDRLAARFEPHNRELFRFLGEEFDWA